MSHALVFCTAAAALTSLPACDGDVSAAPDASPAPADLSLSEYTSLRHQLSCDFYVTCGSMVSDADCDDLENPAQRALALERSITAGTLVFDGAAAAACANGISAAQSCRLSRFADPAPASCGQVFVGQVALGGDCERDEECADGGRCAVDAAGSCGPGSCVAAPADVAEGGDCSSAPCAEGLYCNSSTAAPTCTRRAGLGEPCGGLFSCDAGLLCSTLGSGGTCFTPSASGSPCDPDAAPFPCDNFSDWCNPATMTCEPALSEGAQCAGDAVSSEFACRQSARCSEGTCVDLGGLGDACGASGNGCRDYLRCVDGSCQLRSDSVCTGVPAQSTGLRRGTFAPPWR